MGLKQSTSNTLVTVDRGFPHPVYVRCHSETLKLTEMEQDYKLIFGGNLDASIKEASKTEVKEGTSDRSEENAEGKVNFESRNEEHKTFFSKVITEGFTMIQQGTSLEFSVSVKNVITVYITIYANHDDGKYIHPLCVNLPIDTDDHILVKSNGQVVQSDHKDPFKRKEYSTSVLECLEHGSNTYVAVDKDFGHPVYVRCDSESLKLTEMEQDYELIFGGNLEASIKEASKTEVKEGPSDSSEENAEGKVNFESRTKEYSKFCAKLIQIGFTRIQPGEFLLFRVPAENVSTVYITIYANHHGGKYIHPLCVNLPKDLHTHILVKRNGQVVESADSNLFATKESDMHAPCRTEFKELQSGESTSLTLVAVKKDFPLHVYVRCDSESLHLTETEQKYKLIFGGNLATSMKEASKTEVKEGPSDSSEENAGGKVNFESRTKEYSKFCAKLIQIGFTRIQPGEFLLFNVPAKNVSTVYITIYANHHGGKYIHPICVNFPSCINNSILVVKEGIVNSTFKHPFEEITHWYS